jgi:S1-C subfamily serine protease
MSYDMAQELGINVTYGWRIAEVTEDGPSDGLLQVGDVIIAMNGTLIRNNDDLASYLEEKTLPNEHLVLTVVRNNATTAVDIVLGTRPQPSI